MNIIVKGLKYKGFNEEDIYLLQDSAATKDGIISKLQHIALITKAGDIIYVHYSGHGQQIDDDDYNENDGFEEDDGLDEAIVPWDAQIQYSESYKGERHIRDDELMDLLNDIRKKAGPGGQVVLGVDASHSGPEREEVIVNGRPLFTRGGFLEINPSEQASSTYAPFIFMAAAASDELNYEYGDKANDSVYGVFSYAFYKSLLISNDSTTYNSLYGIIRSIMDTIAPHQHPAIVGNMEELVFEGNESLIKPEPEFSVLNGDLYILSIGIDKYYFQNNLEFNNCSKDAMLFSSFVRDQFKSVTSDSLEIFTYTLLDEMASKDSIIKYINLIMNKAKPEDYFVFSFAGFSNQDYDSISGKSTIDFYTYNNSRDIAEGNVHDKISIQHLKDLLEYVPANNQLFITESGNTKDFQRNFTKALIESNPDINRFRKRNRVIVCPLDIGYDAFTCNGFKIEGGPLVHFITTLPEGINFFYLFGEKEYADKVVHQVNKKQVECNMLDKPYTSFFFEKYYMESIEYLFPEMFSRSRGISTLFSPETQSEKKVGKKHALVVGINDYTKGKPTWPDLTNPRYDASEIAKELQDNYDYNVKLLLDSESDEILQELRNYTDMLDKADQLFIFIAGHGDFDGLFFNDGFIVTSSSKPIDKDLFRKSYISFSNIENIINNLPPNQIFLCLDVCFGGAFDDQVKRIRNRSREDIYGDLEAVDFVANKIDLTTRIYMTSGSLNKVPDGYAGKHSPFAFWILEALRTYGGDDGFITSNQIFSFVEKIHSKPMLGSFGNDEPGSVFFFIPVKRDN